MVQILPDATTPSFGRSLARSLGAGLGEGINRGTDFATQMGLEKFKTKQRQKLIQSIENPQTMTTPQRPEDLKQRFLQALPELENTKRQMTGEDLTPEDTQEIWDFMNQSQNAPQQRQSRSHEEKARAYAAANEHDLARLETELAKIEQKQSFAREKEKVGRHYEIAKPALQEAEQLARSLPQKEAALEEMKVAISEGNLSYFSPDNLAEITGIEAFRSPQGAAFKTAAKEYFLGNTTRVGAKGLNQWFEKQLIDMAPKIGRSTQANLIVSELLDMENEINRRKIDLTEDIAQKMERDSGGFVKRDLAKKVYNELHKETINIQKETKKKIEDIKSRYEAVNKEGHLMRDPAGNLRRVSSKDYKAAKAAGYRVE